MVFSAFFYGFVFTSCNNDIKKKSIETSSKTNSGYSKTTKDSVNNKTLKIVKDDSLIIHHEKFVFNSPTRKICSFVQEYPRVVYKKDTIVEKNINKEILKAFRITEFRKTPKNILCADENSIPSYQVFNLKNLILNIAISHEFYGQGAAHPYHNTDILNIDLITGEKVSATEVFNKDKLPELKNILLSKGQHQLDSLFENDAPDIAEYVNDLVYLASNKGFKFYIQTGNGAIQEIEIFIAYRQLNPCLKRKYQL